MFSESFYVVSMAEYAAATGDAEALRKAEECFELMLRLYRTPESDPYKITPKTYAATRADRASAVPMVLVSSAQLLRRCDPAKADYYTKVTNEMVDAIIDYHYKPERKCVLECVGPNGEFIDNPAGRCVNPGHSMENSWFLMNEAIYSGNKALLEKALNILDWSLELGWDKQYGGFIYFTDIDGRPCEQLEWDMKLWWVHNEALIATLLAYGLTGEKKYFNMFEKVHAYAFGHFADKEYGEWYGYLHKDGTVSHTQKGSMWKGPFHHPRCLMNATKSCRCSPTASRWKRFYKNRAEDRPGRTAPPARSFFKPADFYCNLLSSCRVLVYEWGRWKNGRHFFIRAEQPRNHRTLRADGLPHCAQPNAHARRRGGRDAGGVSPLYPQGALFRE